MRWLVLVSVAACADMGVVSDGVHLSTEGLYEDMGRKAVVAGAIELEPAHALWADGAEKRRWMVLPPGAEIDTSEMDHWQLPIGTKLFKEFLVGGQRVETRLFERVTATDYRLDGYVWLADESDAVVVPDGAQDVLGTTHDIPSKTECVMCHQSEPGRSLGVSAVQLSGMLDELPLSSPVPRVEIPNPALGVLHANCGHCHTDGGIAEMQQLRFSVHDGGLPIEQTAVYQSIVGVPLTDWQGPVELRVAPGDPDASAIVYRMSSRAGRADAAGRNRARRRDRAARGSRLDQLAVSK